jgi:hypothetical protein
MGNTLKTICENIYYKLFNTEHDRLMKEPLYNQNTTNKYLSTHSLDNSNKFQRSKFYDDNIMVKGIQNINEIKNEPHPAIRHFFNKV